MASSDFWVGPTGAPDTYRLISLLGGGGEGEVWKAVLPLSREGRSTVAVKILAADGGIEEQHRWDRFGHLLRSLSHPGLVRVTDVFLGPVRHRENSADPGSRAAYVVMDHVDGPTLREWCDEHPDATASQRLRMLRTVASALDEMHSGAATHVPVAHGDVKPANVVVSDDGATVLVDLGLTRLTDTAGTTGRSAPYAAPELRGPTAQATPEADRYAFVVTTAQVLTGHPVPTTPDGWLDPVALERLLRASPITARRPLLVRQVLEALAAPPEARPRQLRLWLDSAADTLSQVTFNGGQSAAAHVPFTPHQAAITETGPFQPYEAPLLAPPAALRRRRRRPLALAGVMLVLIAAGAAGAFALWPTAVDPQASPADSAAAPTTLAPPVPNTGPTSRPTPSGADASASTTALPATSTFLTTMKPVDRGNHTGDNGGHDVDSFNTNGVHYGRAIGMRAWCTNQEGGDYWVDYDLGRSWNRFTATVGISDDSRSEAGATYTLLADNQVLASGALTLGTSTPIDVSVVNVLRLRLQINEPFAVSDRCYYNSTAQVVWGNPLLDP